MYLSSTGLVPQQILQGCQIFITVIMRPLSSL